MLSCTKQKQFQLRLFYSIDKKPIGFNMAFTESLVFASETMIMILQLKKLVIRQCVDYIRKMFEFKTSFYQDFQHLLELIRWNIRVHHLLPHQKIHIVCNCLDFSSSHHIQQVPLSFPHSAILLISSLVKSNIQIPSFKRQFL